MYKRLVSGLTAFVVIVFLVEVTAWAARPPQQIPRPARADSSVQAVKVNEHGELVAASAGELAQPSIHRQILIFPAGYTAAEQSTFLEDARKMIRGMGNLPDDVFTRRHRDRLLYIINWLPGGSLTSGQANFGSKLYPHPFRGGIGITMQNQKVIDAVDGLARRTLPSLDPIGVIVIYNYNGDVTANAVPPMFLRRGFGIARLTRGDIHATQPYAGRTWGDYVPAHELAHAALNFLDEYTEPMLAELNIRRIDPLTSLLLPDGSWRGWCDAWNNLLGNYDMRLSEMLADNGSGHIATSPFPSTVRTPGFAPVHYGQEGGMMFGRGTFHDTGNNLMNSSFPRKPDGNRFGWGHTKAQMQVLAQVFGATERAPRPNDRLRVAGPLAGWLPQWGQRVRLLLFDADKNHRWHPTRQYQIEMRWHEAGQWWTRRWTISPQLKSLNLRNALAFSWAGRLRDALVGMGIHRLPGANGQGFDLSAMTMEQILEDLLPTVSWPLPYQDAPVSAPVPFQTYYWRFRTHNGTVWSGWTNWSSFYRAL